VTDDASRTGNLNRLKDPTTPGFDKGILTETSNKKLQKRGQYSIKSETRDYKRLPVSSSRRHPRIQLQTLKAFELKLQIHKCLIFTTHLESTWYLQNPLVLHDT